MSTQSARADAFKALHVRGKPVVLYNVWDAGSARAVAAAGARAIATGSWSVAAAQGFEDGEQMPLDLAIANLERIVAAVDLPVTIDLESGYGEQLESAGATLARAIAAGAIGCNLEDSLPATRQLREPAEQAARLRQARRTAESSGVPAFINARTDVFLVARDTSSPAANAVDAALERAQLYAAAGADGLFVPGLTEERLIARVVEGSPLPVNVMATDKTPPLGKLAELGVARVSYGPRPYRLLMKALEDAARAALG